MYTERGLWDLSSSECCGRVEEIHLFVQGVCVHACMRVCMRVCVRACMRVLCCVMYVCVYVYTYVCMYIRIICVCVCLCPYIHIVPPHHTYLPTYLGTGE